MHCCWFALFYTTELKQAGPTFNRLARAPTYDNQTADTGASFRSPPADASISSNTVLTDSGVRSSAVFEGTPPPDNVPTPSIHGFVEVNSGPESLAVASAPASPSTTPSAKVTTLTPISSFPGGGRIGGPIYSLTRTTFWNSTTATSTLSSRNSTVTTSTLSNRTISTLTPTNSSNECPLTTDSATYTVTSTIYTSTTTWTGDPADYTPPFPTTPSLTCTPEASSVQSLTGGSNTPLQETRPTLSYASSSAKSTVTFYTTSKNPAVVYSSSPPPSYDGTQPGKTEVHTTASIDQITTPDYGVTPTTPQAGTPPPPPPPSPGEPTTGAQTTAAAPDGDGQGNQDPGNPRTHGPVTVVVQVSQVVLNGETFTNNAQSQTSTVIVGSQTFVIDPSEVIGDGVTVTRPTTEPKPTLTTSTSSTTSEPTTTDVDGLHVVIHSGAVDIDGTIVSLGPTPTAVVIHGQTVTFDPTFIAFPSETVAIVPNNIGPTETVVLGGDLLTAIGQSVVVLDGRTSTYSVSPGANFLEPTGASPTSPSTLGGPGISATTFSVIDSDTILLGPQGITVHSKTLGGPTAAPTATTYEIVGGATITEFYAWNAVVINGLSFTLENPPTTTVIAEETLTIGKGGVTSGDLTLTLTPASEAAWASTTVIDPAESGAFVGTSSASGQGTGMGTDAGTGTSTGAGATGAGTATDPEETNAGSVLSASSSGRVYLFVMTVCIAIGVGFF